MENAEEQGFVDSVLQELPADGSAKLYVDRASPEIASGTATLDTRRGRGQLLLTSLLTGPESDLPRATSLRLYSPESWVEVWGAQRNSISTDVVNFRFAPDEV